MQDNMLIHVLVLSVAMMSLAESAGIVCPIQMQFAPEICCPIQPPNANDAFEACKPKDLIIVEDNRIGCDVMKCTMNEFTMLNDDGSVNRTKVMSKIKSLYSADWQTAIEESVNESFELVDAKGCEPYQFFYFMSFALIKNCPDKLWTRSNKCEALKNYSANFLKNSKTSKYIVCL